MAVSTYNGNTFYTDQVSSASTVTTYIDEKDMVVEGLILTASGSTSEVIIHDLVKTDNAFKAGDLKLHVKCLANETKFISLVDTPVRFPNGIWIATITASADVTLILKRKG